MKTLPFWQVDAFTDRLFAGNPAGVVLLDDWLPDALMASIAAENNLAETAFAVQRDADQYDLRWFTPAVEVPLCGHATLATAHILFTEGATAGDRIMFETRSGPLYVTRHAHGYSMSLPADPPRPIANEAARASIGAALGVVPTAVFGGRYLLTRFDDPHTVLDLAPDFRAMAALAVDDRDTEGLCVVATAPGEPGSAVDFISRFFGPTVGIDEDPVTGSAHAMLTPYWHNELRQENLVAEQRSARGGRIQCRLEEDRVILTGNAVTYLKGEIAVPA